MVFPTPDPPFIGRPGISTGDPPTSTAFGSLDSEFLAMVDSMGEFDGKIPWVDSSMMFPAIPSGKHTKSY
jgi:hypothetical protein